MGRVAVGLILLVALEISGAAAGSSGVDYGAISHQGLESLGPASPGLRLTLELGLIADQQGIADALKSASNPSSTYGHYLTLSELQQKYGASSSRRNAVVEAFKPYGVTATVDVTHLRVSATITIGDAQKLFGTKWDLYATGQTGESLALPVDTPKLGQGLAGNIDTVSGLGLEVTQGVSASVVDGGTPTRTGTIDAGCASSKYPDAVRSTAGLFPNQILTAYGIVALHSDGLEGQGERIAILGEAPTPADDVTAYRDCASRTLVNRQLAATAALGITVVVAGGDSGSSACAHGVPASQLDSFDKQRSTSWPATSPYVLAVGGTNVTLTSANAIESSGVWNDTTYPSPYENLAAGGGGTSSMEDRPWWQPALPSQSTWRMVPDVSAFADASPGYVIICSHGVQGCGPAQGQTIEYVGGTSAATPLVAGMIALWDQKATHDGYPRPGFVPPLLYSIARNDPSAFRDITVGDNTVFANVSCCKAEKGFDLASGLGSPLASEIADHLHH